MGLTHKESKAFLRILGWIAVLWGLLGALLFGKQPSGLRVFLQVYQAVLLDLSCLILLFWELFFRANPVRKLRVAFYFTFKLVCLGFLAITLKRLRNEPPFPAAVAVLFMGLGPILSAVWLKRLEKTK
jgi:hypothetical protein